MTRAALLTLGLAVGLLAGGCGDATRSSAGDAPATRTSSVAPSTAAPPSERSSPTASGTVQTPVYFVGPTPQGPRLFSELREVRADDPVDEALAALAAGPSDPDDTTYLRAGALRMASHDEAAVLVVPDPAWATRPDGLTDRQARLALQQVVLTVQAALGTQLPAGFTTADRGSVGGGFFGLTSPRAANGYVAADPIDVLGLVNVTTPAEGDAASGSLIASGTASSFEGTVHGRVLDGDGRQALDGVAQGGFLDVGPWQTSIDVSSLPAATDTFVATTDDPSGGTEGPGPTRDTKTIVVS